MGINGEEIKEKSKTWISNIISQYKKPLFLIVLGVVSIILLVIAFNSYGKDYVVKIINNLVENQTQTIQDNFNAEIKTRDNQLQNLQKRLSASEKTTADIKKRLGDVEIDIKNRKAPATSAELRDRSNKLGYKPVN
jgi:predicted PurR-regulated permease PerM